MEFFWIQAMWGTQGQRERKEDIAESNQQKVLAHLYLVNLCFVVLMIHGEETEIGETEGVGATLATLQ